MNFEVLHQEEPFDVTRTLAPVRRSLGLGRALRGALLGLAVGAVLGAGLLLAGQLWAPGVTRPEALLVVLAGIMVGMGSGLARWPGKLEAARRLDQRLALGDRVTTALELCQVQGTVARLQRRDTARRLEGVRLSPDRPRPGRLEVAALLAVLLLGGAMAGGGPRPAPHHVHLAITTRTTAAARTIRRLGKQLHQGLTPAQVRTPQLRRFDRALARLRRQLSHASNPAQALHAVSATQSQLRALAHQLHPINSQAVAQLRRSLAHAPGPGRTASHPTSAAATSQLLHALATALQRLSPARQEALARALAQAANRTSDNSLRSMLRQAASSLANGDQAGARRSLQQAARSLAQSAGARAAQTRLARAAGKLDAVKNQIAGLTGPSAPPRAIRAASVSRPGGASPSRAGRGRGKRGSSATAPGPARGTKTGQGSGRGRRSGRGQGRTAGARGAAGRGKSGQYGAGGTDRSRRTGRHGPAASVYVPGHQGQGQEVVQSGPKGSPRPGAIVPYQQVLARYTHSAHQALDHTALPPSLQAYVRRYFGTISR